MAASLIPTLPNHPSPAEGCVAVTPNDTVPLTLGPCRAIYVGVGGDITLSDTNGHTGVLFKAVPQGTTLPVRATLIAATGTTASQLVALY